MDPFKIPTKCLLLLGFPRNPQKKLVMRLLAAYRVLLLLMTIYFLAAFVHSTYWNFSNIFKKIEFISSFTGMLAISMKYFVVNAYWSKFNEFLAEVEELSEKCE
jgi:peptidoglycan/LPS O-acetylase OafA/YrhL